MDWIIVNRDNMSMNDSLVERNIIIAEQTRNGLLTWHQCLTKPWPITDNHP